MMKYFVFFVLIRSLNSCYLSTSVQEKDKKNNNNVFEAIYNDCQLLAAVENAVCCNRCPEIKEIECKKNEELATTLKKINEGNQQALAYLDQNLKELQKVTKYLNDNFGTNKILTSLLPQIMTSKDSLESTSKEFEEILKSLSKDTDLQSSVPRSLLQITENTDKKLNDSFSLLRNSFQDMLTNFTTTLKKEVKLELQPFDCSDILKSGQTASGVYRIYPKGAHDVFCNMETDGGGWTVFLFRQKQEKQENFYRNWQDYKDGFGNPSKEYWLGNEALYSMTTRTRSYSFRLDARAGEAESIWGVWRTFKVDSESTKYKIFLTDLKEESTVYNTHVEGYFNNQKFSTYDSDNDESGSNCAQDYKGGWWYNDCKNMNPTGLYGQHSNEGIDFNSWSTLDNTERYADWLQLMIRPN